MRGILAGALTLIALQALGSGNGPTQGGKLLVWLSTGLRHALSPKIAAVPVVKGGATPSKSTPAAPAPATPTPGISLPRNPSVGGPVTV